MNVDRCSQLIELMKICEYSMSFLDLGPRSFTMKIETCFSQKSLDNFNQILYVNFKVR